MSEREDLGVLGVAGLKDPADSGRDQACERGKQVDKPVDDTDLDSCLLYTSDAADERSSVDLGGRRIIKKKK